MKKIFLIVAIMIICVYAIVSAQEASPSASMEEVSFTTIVAKSSSGSSGLPKTGQTISYAPGDDGDLQKGVSVTGPRFINTPGTSNSVTDTATKLIWVKDADAIGVQGEFDFTLAGSGITWPNALLAVAVLNSIKYDNATTEWRLPNINELRSRLVKQDGFSWGYPDFSVFSDMESSSWSSTTDALAVSGPGASAWQIWLGNVSMTILFKNDMLANSVRPVRDAE